MELPRSRLARPSWRWIGMLAATVGVLGVALAPPALSPRWRAVVMHAFSPLCHQLSARSPAIGGVQVAICDRCTGIYLGLVLGVATVGWGHWAWKALDDKDVYLLLAGLVPLGIDWVGPVLGLWGNGPLSRALTGLLFGLVAASFAADRMLWDR